MIPVGVILVCVAAATAGEDRFLCSPNNNYWGRLHLIVVEGWEEDRHALWGRINNHTLYCQAVRNDGEVTFFKCEDERGDKI